MLPLAGVCLLLVLLLPEEALAAGIRDGLRDGLDGIGDGDPRWLGVTGLLMAASLAGSALAWRAALGACGAPCGRADAVARYGVGSLANAVLPTRIGGVAADRALLAARATRRVRSGRRAARRRSAGLARSLWLGALVALASTTGLLPLVARGRAPRRSALLGIGVAL